MDCRNSEESIEMKPKEVLLKFIEAFNNADVEVLADLYCDDAVNHIVFQRGYWDKLSFLRQHGLPIPRE